MTNGWAMLHRARRVHLVGIGGSGMSGIAELLLDLGYRVTGSDLAATAITAQLASRGAQVKLGHDPAHVRDVDVVVISSAVPPHNPEVEAARAQRVPVIKRAEMLAELMRLKHGVVVAGSHGKTTTTAMVTAALTAGGLDPSAVVGGRPNGWVSSSRVGSSDLLVAEADESDGSFLHLPPTFALITNVDPEHLEYYGGELSALDDAFVEFTERVPFWGSLTVCVDDEGIRRILPRFNRRLLTYGTDESADVRLGSVDVGEDGTQFTVRLRGAAELRGRIRLLGRHNALNAVGALTLAREIGVAPSVALEALSEFRGVDRRLSVRGRVAGTIVADDYGHHPTEIRATLEGVRAAYPGRKIRVGFQPHRYSRTRDFFREFAHSFTHADEIAVVPIYAAGESSLEGVDSAMLTHAICGAGGDARSFRDMDAMIEHLASNATAEDLILLLGAGDIHRCSDLLVARLEARAGRSS